LIGDESGSSSTALTELAWSEYSVSRAIPAAAGEVVIGVEWRGMPGNGWLELRNMVVEFAAGGDTMDGTVALAPTDTPTPRRGLPTPPPATPTPTSPPPPELPTATPLATATAVVTPTPELIIVTSTSTPVDIFEEATRAVMATEWARILGPVTATPPNLVTPTPTLTPIVLVNTPTPGNGATATYEALYATAVAVTTGTPTPFPPGAVVLVATDTPVPVAPTVPPPPTLTPTPVVILLADIPTPAPVATEPLPEELLGKIVFLSFYRNIPWAPDPMVINPDGSDPGLLTSRVFYDRAILRDAYSATKQYRAYALPEGGGEAHNAGLIQIFYDDLVYGSRHQLTYFGVGTAWAPAFSPTQDVVALVSSESANDEIWIGELRQWPALQVTKNDWEWDHHPSFSPDGREIVFHSNRVTGRRQLWVMDLQGNARQLTNFPFEAWDPVWVKYPDT
jgi:hypothetical protein